MFKTEEAETYDCSTNNFYVVALAAIILSVFGCLNTYFDQFYRCSLLPRDRNESSCVIITDYKTYKNKIYINFSLKSVFSITYENFLDSMAIVLNQSVFTSIFQKGDFFDYKREGDNYSFYVLSSIYGEVTISLNYLETELLRRNEEFPYLSYVFPGYSGSTKKFSYYRFREVAFKNNTLLTFFKTRTFIEHDEIAYESGVKIPVKYMNDRISNYCNNSQKGKYCDHWTKEIVLFTEPPPNKSPFATFISLLNPMAKYLLEFSDNAEIAVLSNPNFTYPCKELIKFFPNLKFITPTDSIEIDELIMRYRTWHSPEPFSRLFGECQRNDKLISLLLDKDTIISKYNRNYNETEHDIKKLSQFFLNLTSKRCNECKIQFIKPALENNTFRQIKESNYLITTKTYAYYMFALQRNSTIFVIDDEFSNEDNWLREMSFHKNLNIQALPIGKSTYKELTPEMFV